MEMEIRPERIDDLDGDRLQALFKRSMAEISAIYDDMRRIVEEVRKKGDAALLDASREFKSDPKASDLEVSREEIASAYKKVPEEVLGSLKKAAANITRFHEAQIEREMWSIEVSKGILAGRVSRPIERVGCYIPGGRAAYPSTTLMTILPARVAGVSEIIATTPPAEGMTANPVTVVAADIARCDRIFKVGGPWGIAALAYGTESMPRVDKIVGPGNKYVTAAKMAVYGQVGIDSPAGPSESLILADETAEPELVAVDFLSQIEHDVDSAAVLVTTSQELGEAVCRIIRREYEDLPRKEIIGQALAGHSYVLIAKDMDQGIDFANQYAPEHLQILAEEPFIILNRIRHAGSIFLGPNAPVPVGDYASGTNHVLPTSQCARMFSGLSVDDFMKRPTFQYLSKEGLATLKDTVITLAEIEGLPIHARAVRARFDKDVN